VSTDWVGMASAGLPPRRAFTETAGMAGAHGETSA